MSDENLRNDLGWAMMTLMSVANTLKLPREKDAAGEFAGRLSNLDAHAKSVMRELESLRQQVKKANSKKKK